MKIYYPKDKNGNEIAFRTPENFVYDTTGESLSTKLENLSSSIGNIKGSVSDDVTALDKKFTEAIENRATNSDLEIERKRIDNIAKLSSGSTTGDAELIDIRTMTDGTTAANAGTAVRTQIKNLITSESNKTGTTKMTYKLGTEQAVPDITEYSNLINALSEEVYSETLSNSGKGYLVDENKNVHVNDIVSVKCDADKQDGLTIVIRYNDGTVDKHITTLNNMLVTSEMKTIEVSTTKTATFIVKRINSNEKNGLILSAIENMRKALYINLLNDMHLATGDIGTGGNSVDNDNSYRSSGYSDLSYEKKTEIEHDLPVFLLFTSDYNITIKVFYYEKHTCTLNQSMTKTYACTSGSRTQIKLLPNYYNKFVFTFNDLTSAPSIIDFKKASFLSYEYERFDIQNYIPLTTGKGGWEWKNINTAIAPYVEPRLANITNRLPLILNQIDELKEDINDIATKHINYLLSLTRITGKFYIHRSTSIATAGENVKTEIYGEIPIKAGITYYYRNFYAYFCNIVYNDGTIVALSETTNAYQSGSFTAEKDGKILITVSLSTPTYYVFTNSEKVNNYYYKFQENIYEPEGLRSLFIEPVLIQKSNYRDILPDCDTAKSGSVYRLVFSKNETEIPLNTPFGNSYDVTCVCLLICFGDSNKGVSIGDYQLFFSDGTIYSRQYSARLSSDGITYEHYWGDWFIVAQRNEKADNVPRVIVVDKNGNGDYTSLLEGILYATESMYSTVYVRAGVYDLVSEFEDYYGSDFFANSMIPVVEPT